MQNNQYAKADQKEGVKQTFNEEIKQVETAPENENKDKTQVDSFSDPLFNLPKELIENLTTSLNIVKPTQL
jgi:hypothetical protein